MIDLRFERNYLIHGVPLRVASELQPAAIQAASPGAQISYFRAPGGNWTAPIVEAARHLGMASLDWAVDPRDWTVPTTASIATNASLDAIRSTSTLNSSPM